METFYAVYEKATGLLYSTGSVISLPLNPALDYIEAGSEQPDASLWNPSTRTFTVLPPETVATILAKAVKALVAKIDKDTDAIYGAVIGNRASEYAVAEEEAQQFKVAGYAGAVPDSVESWANAKSWTATQAADDIIATAAAWRTAQKSIRYNRLGAKEAARLADTVASLDAIAGQWAGFVVHIRTALGIA